MFFFLLLSVCRFYSFDKHTKRNTTQTSFFFFLFLSLSMSMMCCFLLFFCSFIYKYIQFFSHLIRTLSLFFLFSDILYNVTNIFLCDWIALHCYWQHKKKSNKSFWNTVRNKKEREVVKIWRFYIEQLANWHRSKCNRKQNKYHLRHDSIFGHYVFNEQCRMQRMQLKKFESLCVCQWSRWNI